MLPINAKQVNLIHFPIKEISKNCQNGKLVTPAAIPARSKNGFGIVANIKRVSAPFIFIKYFIRSYHTESVIIT